MIIEQKLWVNLWVLIDEEEAKKGHYKAALLDAVNRSNFDVIEVDTINEEKAEKE